MCTTIRIVLAMVREAFLSRAALHLENLALRQQLAALDRKGARPSLRMADRLFWVVLSRLWSGWREILVIVKPETVIGWHRKGFPTFLDPEVATGEAGTTARVERIPRAYPPDVSGESVVGRSPNPR